MKSFLSKPIRNLFPIFVIAVATLGQIMAEEPKPPAEWVAWANWAEKQSPISDESGHGPDIGSDEWATALDRRLGITDKDGHGPDLKSEEWKSAAERKLIIEAASPPADAADSGEKRKRLSSHDTEARFLGIKDHRCMGLTALCPDRCGHSGKLARFEILKYISFRKSGEYGDPKQKEFVILIEDNEGNPKVSEKTLEAIRALKSGEEVRLKWNHDYVTREGSSFPERHITEVSPHEKPPLLESE